MASRIGVTSPNQDQNMILQESDLLKILAESMNFSRHSKTKSMNNMFYNNGDNESVFNGEDAMSTFSGVQSQNKDSHYRLCLRIWSGFSKYIRSQCNKDRICDSVYFGQFLKSNMGDAENPRYIFVNDNSKSNSLNSVHSAENLDLIP